MRTIPPKLVLIALLISIILSGCASQDENTIVIKGSDTMVYMVSVLAQEYMKIDPEANIIVSGGGSGTGIKALINGFVDVADASRPIKESEINKIKQKFGINPKSLIVARDMLAVVVNPENPVENLTMLQLGKIFAGEITNWKEVGGKDCPITLYGRQSTSGTYEFFREHVVEAYTGKKEYSANMRSLTGNTQIHDAVASDPNGIGYIGVGYVTDKVKIVKVSEDGVNYYSPFDAEAVQAGKYMISRPLFQYMIHYPKRSSVLYNFLRFEVSEEGQKIVEETGFYPIFEVDRKANEDNLWSKID
ncbi:MAG TPA: phosphate ABC transporter substrate-binding protein [Archaeoglobaceae archaeon]|nr:phosphate ABC transporter substrate-binding protein [Archaeoglobaceae archaeon]